MKAGKWFDDLLETYQDDLAFRTEAAILEFNEKIVAHMTENGISRVELSRRLGVTKAFVTKMLNGNPNLTIKTMMSVADALGCELNLDVYPKGGKARNFYVYSGKKKVEKAKFTKDVEPGVGDGYECAA